MFILGRFSVCLLTLADHFAAVHTEKCILSSQHNVQSIHYIQVEVFWVVMSIPPSSGWRWRQQGPPKCWYLTARYTVTQLRRLWKLQILNPLDFVHIFSLHLATSQVVHKSVLYHGTLSSV